MTEPQANREAGAEHQPTEQTGSQHPGGGPVAGADFCPHCHRQAFINGVCRECDWPG